MLEIEYKIEIKSLQHKISLINKDNDFGCILIKKYEERITFLKKQLNI